MKQHKPEIGHFFFGKNRTFLLWLDIASRGIDLEEIGGQPLFDVFIEIMKMRDFHNRIEVDTGKSFLEKREQEILVRDQNRDETLNKRDRLNGLY